MKIAARVMWYSKGRPFPRKIIDSFACLGPLWHEYNSLTALADEHGPFASLQVIEDDVGRGCWHTARRAWLDGIDSGATHVLVLNDDAVLCKDFCTVLPRAVASRPDRMLSLFAMRQTVERFAAQPFNMAQKGGRWIDTNIWCNGLSIVMPSEVAAKAIQWINENLVDNEANDEIGFQLYFAIHGPPIAICSPSLVEHDPSMISTKSHHYSNAGAQAYSFAGDNALQLEWPSDGVPWLTDVRPLLCQNKGMFKYDSPVRREWRLD